MWNNQNQICEVGKLNQPPQDGGNIFQPMNLSFESAKQIERAEKRTRGKGILSSVADTGAELFINKGIPYLAKKGVEAGRYYASEFMRNPKLQTKAINYATKKATPVIQKVGSEAMKLKLGVITNTKPTEWILIVICTKVVLKTLKILAKLIKRNSLKSI